MFWSGAAHDQNRACTPSTIKFAALNNFELSTQFVGQKLPSAYLPTARCYPSCIWLTKRLPRTPPGTVTS